MKTAAITPILALILAAACLVADEQPTVTTFETRLLGVWKLWSSEPKPQPKSCRLTQLDFQSNGFIRWVTQCDGKTNEQTGRYSIETSSNVYHRYTLTHIIRVQTMGSPPESVIYLVGADIGSDNRVPVHAEVLKFRDAFVSSFVFVKDDGQPSTEGVEKHEPMQTAALKPFPQEAQSALERLNGACKSEAWRNQIDRLERPKTSIEANGLVSGEVSSFVSDCKERLAKHGVQVKWNTDKKIYEVEKTQQSAR